jgi:hypothetical protein
MGLRSCLGLIFCIFFFLINNIIMLSSQCLKRVNNHNLLVFNCRSASGNGASEALQSLSVDVGIPHLGFSGYPSSRNLMISSIQNLKF